MIDEFNEHHEEARKAAKPTPRRLNTTYKKDPHLVEAEQLMNEISDASNSDTVLAEFCAGHIYKWRKDRNPHHVDLALYMLIANGVDPTPTLIKVIGEVAAARLNGDLAGTANKLAKENFKNQAFTIMLNLTFAGAKIDEAASKAAQWYKMNFATPIKASSLEKDYAKVFRKADKQGITQEQEYHFFWSKNKSQEAIDWWKLAREKMPLADSDIAGVRRR